jgi:RNA polymerase sigma factor (sigma-70 family)
MPEQAAPARAGPPDEELVAAGGAEGFTAFYRRHVRGLLGHLMRLTGDPDLAADLMAETFAAALVQRERFDPGRGSAAGWLYGIAHNKLADSRRRGYAEDRAMRRLGMERVALTAADRRDVAYLGEVAVVELLAALPDDQRRAVRARVVEDRDYADIAGELSVSEQTARKRVSRGLEALRQRLGGEP